MKGRFLCLLCALSLHGAWAADFVWYLPCSVGEIAQLDRQSTDTIAQLLGKPANKTLFTLGDRAGELYIALQNHYPLSTTGNADVPIYEWHWHQEDCHLSVWFDWQDNHWRSLTNMRWHHNVHF